MIDIRFHGRGGQGAVLASKILASAYFAQGYYVQAFPFFGMERKGAAVAAFVRVATRSIVERGEVRNPSIVVVLDSTLLTMVDVTKGVEYGGAILLDHMAQDDRRPLDGSFRIATVDARSIALKYGLGSKIAPIVNTVILGAFAKIAGNLDLEHLLAAIKAIVPNNPEQNAAAANAAFSEVRWVYGQPAAPMDTLVQPEAAIQSYAEIPVMPETRGAIDWNQTGTWRYLTPVAENKLPPCKLNCPAGMSIPGIIQAVNQGENLRALQMVLSVNPLPGLTSRLCYHPCQTDCIRKKIDSPVAIQHLERFIAAQDCSHAAPTRLPNPIARVAVVGAGPIGLTCGYFLGRSGCSVMIMASETRAGGALLSISPDKLDPQVLKREIERLVRLSNVEFRLGVPIDRNLLAELPSTFDLIILDPLEMDAKFPVKDEIAGFIETGEGNANKVILPDPSREFKPFKYSLIARYVAVGRQLAGQAHAHLVGRNRLHPEAKSVDGQVNSEPLHKPLDPGEIRAGQFSADNSHAAKPPAKGMALDAEQSHSEASRCLSCGTCNLCLQCLSSCPDVSIHYNQDSTGVSFDLRHCKGCGICARECPRGVIRMEKIIV